MQKPAKTPTASAKDNDVSGATPDMTTIDKGKGKAVESKGSDPKQAAIAMRTNKASTVRPTLMNRKSLASLNTSEASGTDEHIPDPRGTSFILTSFAHRDRNRDNPPPLLSRLVI
jgi:hypothetical protein